MDKRIIEVEIKLFAHGLIDAIDEGRVATVSDISDFTVEYLEKLSDEFSRIEMECKK